MLGTIRASGEKPPLFLLHGNTGFMGTGDVFARVTGPDQPIYVINAKGFDGSEPRDTVDEMVADYLDEILGVTQGGPLTIVGQCWGSLVALELATQLLDKGCEMGPLFLMDPPRIPFRRAPDNVSDDARRQLYDYTRGTLLKLSNARYLDLPFDLNDPDQLHMAVTTAAASITAVSRFTPRPFLGAAELILSSETAAPFFAKGNPWQSLLPNTPVTHVLPFGHNELMQRNRFEVAHLIALMILWNERQMRREKAAYALADS